MFPHFSRPRLGPTFHRILFVGVLYFSLASFEAYLRVLHPVNGPSNKALMAGIPLSVVDAAIFYWIFHSLMTTTRTLRLRRYVDYEMSRLYNKYIQRWEFVCRNLVKLNLYRHFTNTLTFSVVASIFFMIWSIRTLKTAQCIRVSCNQGE